MFVYRISQTKYASSLSAPGIDARWNSVGQRIVYTAGSVALACLENLAHKSGASLSSGDFSMSIIEINNDVKINEISISELIARDKQWHKVENYPITQELGDSWVIKQESAILKVPSAIIDLEFNYLINPLHVDFSKIKILKLNKFTFDPRLKNNG